MKKWVRRRRGPLAGLLALSVILGLSATMGTSCAATNVSIDRSSDPLTAFSDAIEIAGAPVAGVNAGVRAPMGIVPMAAAGAMPKVIWNYPANPGTTKQIPLDQMTWNKSGIHSFYDRAYTTKTSKAYNGTATPAHVVLSRTAIRFLGYGANSNLDLVYTDAYSSFQTLDFTFNPTLAKFHTLNQSGFLFNGSFGGPGNAYYTGYALVLDATAQVAANQVGTAALKLVYINNQLLSTTGNNTFPPSGISFMTQDTIIANIVEGKTPSFHVELVRSATGFDLYIDGNLVREVDPAQNMNLPGFGFFTGYYSHNCVALTVVEYSNVALTVNVTPATTAPMVTFVDKDTGVEIAPAQTAPSNSSQSFVNDEFLVDASLVQTITDSAGNNYAYVGGSVPTLNPLTYKAGGAANNTVILYYKNPATLPEKHVSVNGVADDGTAASPVDVSQGDIIDYRIDVKAAAGAAAQPIVYGGTDPANRSLDSLTASDSGFVGTASPGTWTSYTGVTTAGYLNGTYTVSAANAPLLQSIRRYQAANITTNSAQQHYLWLTTKDSLPAGSYAVTIKVAADARTWGQTGETGGLSPSTNVAAFMRGIVGGASTLSTATYNKPGGYGTFTDQFFPAATGSPLPTTPTFVGGTNTTGRITFRDNGPTPSAGVSTNDTRGFAAANSNTAPFVTTETSTFQSPLVLGSDQPAVIGLVLGAQLSGNTQSSQEHYTSLIRVFSVTFTPLGPPPAPYDVSDLLPDGITLASDLPDYVTYSSSADPTYAGADATFTTTQDADTGRQQLSWSFPNLPGDTSIHVKARVTASSGIFENSALVTNKSAPVVVPDQTNSTWHKAAVAMVTVKYVNFLTGDTLQGDTYSWLAEGDGYGVAPGLLAAVQAGPKTFRYYAYLPDDGAVTPIQGAPPDGQPTPDPNGDGGDTVLVNDNLYDAVYGNSRVVILYFLPDVQVTIISVDHGVVVRPSTVRDPALRTWVDYSVPGGVPYIMPVTQMDSLNGYNYVSVYDLNYGNATNGTPATPVFSQAEMYQDNEITLDFAQDPLITLKFAEDGNESHILHNPMTDIVPLGSDYDPAQTGPPSRLQDSITGAWYQFVGYRLDSVDSAATIYSSDIGTLASISQVAANHTYRLLYALATTTLTISKVVTGQFGDLTRQFAFTVTLTGADGQPLAGPLAYTGDPDTGPGDGSLLLDRGVGVFTLRHGQSITVQDVPADCSVRVVETPDAGYTISIADSEGAVIPDPASPGDTGVLGMTSSPRALTFTNTRVIPPPTGVSLGDSGLVLLSALGPLLMLAFWVGRRKILRRTGRVSGAGIPARLPSRAGRVLCRGVIHGV